jgi:hypothetical protein
MKEEMLAFVFNFFGAIILAVLLFKFCFWIVGI